MQQQNSEKHSFSIPKPSLPPGGEGKAGQEGTGKDPPSRTTPEHVALGRVQQIRPQGLPSHPQLRVQVTDTRNSLQRVELPGATSALGHKFPFSQNPVISLLKERHLLFRRLMAAPCRNAGKLSIGKWNQHHYVPMRQAAQQPVSSSPRNVLARTGQAWSHG